MTCKHCLTASTRPHSGAYDFGCLECCARLVLTTRPSIEQRTAMLAAISRFPGAPSRTEILACAKQKLEKPL